MQRGLSAVAELLVVVIEPWRLWGTGQSNSCLEKHG